VLVAGWFDNDIGVFDINGNRQETLKIFGIMPDSKKSTPRIDIDSNRSLMYIGVSDGTVNLLDLTYEVI
jgi:hypothetical protein